MRRSQAAMEFLMTYGWALLVVLIVIAALAFFGLLNPSNLLPAKCEIAPGISCLDHTATTNDSDESKYMIYTSHGAGTEGGDTFNRDYINLLINNGLGTTMYNVRVNITECGNGSNSSEGTGTRGGVRVNLSEFNFTSDNSVTSMFASSIAEGDTFSFKVPCGFMIPNQRFKSDVIMNYTTVTDGNTLTHTKTGYINIPVQYAP